MSELPSALFSIADGSEFRFTRFYIVCEAVPLGAPESPLIVCGLRTHLVESPNMERHRIRCPTRHGRNIRIFLQRIAASGCIWNAIVPFSCHKTYPGKMQSMTTPFSGNKKRKRKRFLLRVGLLLLTVAVPRGIEPLFSPWEGDVLTAWPRNHTVYQIYYEIEQFLGESNPCFRRERATS